MMSLEFQPLAACHCHAPTCRGVAISGIAEPIPKRKRGSFAPLNDKKGVTKVLDEDTVLLLFAYMC
jgi:hypothetical protein